MNRIRLFNVVLQYMRRACFIFMASLSFLFVFMRQGVSAQTYEYDDLNRVVKVIYEDESYTVYEYDTNGNMKSQTFHESEKDNTPSDDEKKEESNTPPDDKNDENGKKPEDQGQQQGSNGQSQNRNLTTGSNTSDKKKPTKKIYKVGMKIKTENASYVITSVGKTKTVTFQKLNKKKTSYKIPSYIKIDGVKYKVTKIATKAFKNNKNIKKVTIGKYVTSIGKNAFYGCKRLKTITIQSTKLKSVGKDAFKGIYKKARIKVPRKQYKKYSKLLKGKGQKKTVVIRKSIV